MLRGVTTRREPFPVAFASGFCRTLTHRQAEGRARRRSRTGFSPVCRGRGKGVRAAAEHPIIEADEGAVAARSIFRPAGLSTAWTAPMLQATPGRSPRRGKDKAYQPARRWPRPSREADRRRRFPRSGRAHLGVLMSPTPNAVPEGGPRTGGPESADPRPSEGPATARQPRRRAVTATANVPLTPTIHVLTFSLPPNDSMEFVPGQYVTFFFRRDGKSVTRSYSIYSSANLHDRFSLLIKRVPQGFASNRLCDLTPSPAATETILGPLGKFLYRPPGDRHVVMVATGVGLAPFIPMLERLQAESPATPTWLVWGNRFMEDLVGRSDLERKERSWPNFHFVPVLSRPPPDGSWSGAVGHVQAQVRARFPDLSHADVYLCGATPMVNEMQDLSLELGCPRDQIYVDRWGEHSG